ncbi:hypothetical protein Scep_017365 [Stephania cephalantha]|uniref:Uncharacterized protein n=1 Tax=Stephania cephalantha TaxID=152367 RepID=A0AAP0NTH3_9MAGN
MEMGKVFAVMFLAMLALAMLETTQVMAEPVWIWKSQELSVLVAMLEEMPEIGPPQEGVPVFLQQMLHQVSLRATWLRREQAGLPLLQQLEDPAGWPQVPLNF